MDCCAGGSEPPAKIDESAQALIGERLKAIYSEMVREPVPEQLLKLLDELERKEKDR